MKIASFFSGADGLGLGFKLEGFETIWANEYDKKIWDTFELNYPNVPLDKRSLSNISSHEIPVVDGIIGGPPCPPWCTAGPSLGVKDKRGLLFFEFVKMIQEKQPKFFVIENVKGILSNRHIDSFLKIYKELETSNYDVSWKCLNANDFNVPQERKRVFFVGYHKKINKKFKFPQAVSSKPVLKDAVYGLPKAVPFPETCQDLKNHEYFKEGSSYNFSPHFLDGNKRRGYTQPSLTILAHSRYIPFSPDSPEMVRHLVNGKFKYGFIKGKESLYRRFSVRECALIQTFPDNFVFKYNSIEDGYKQVGNAVPPNLSRFIAKSIYSDLNN